MQKIKKLIILRYVWKSIPCTIFEFHPGFELLGSWERSKKLIQQDYPSVNSYASLEDLLRSDAHLVIVNTPVGTHFEYAKKVLLAGNTL
jgi:predicted dehydrogenase